MSTQIMPYQSTREPDCYQQMYKLVSISFSTVYESTYVYKSLFLKPQLMCNLQAIKLLYFKCNFNFSNFAQCFKYDNKSILKHLNFSTIFFTTICR